MSRKLAFNVDRQPIDLEIGGDSFHPPAVIAPDVLGDLLDMQSQMSAIFGKLTALPDGTLPPPGALKEALEFLASVYAMVLPPHEAAQFRERLFDRANPYDLTREVVPALIALVEEYSGRPTQPSPPSSTLPSGDGTTSTAGLPAVASTPSTSPLVGSVT